MNTEQEACLTEVLEKYCEWLTMWAKTDDESYEYKVDEFFGQYGYTELLVDNDQGYYRLMHFVVNNGDDGGGSELTCYFDKGSEIHDPNDLRHIVQQFDTMLQPIYDSTEGPEGKFLNTPSDKGY